MRHTVAFFSALFFTSLATLQAIAADAKPPSEHFDLSHWKLTLPTSGQIHGYSGKARPLIKLQFFKGRIEALVKESPTKGKDLKLTFPEVGLDKDFDYEIQLHDGLLNVSVNGTTQTINVFETDPEWAQQTLYFKVGAYVQDNEGPDSEGARVLISRLRVSHAETPLPKGETPKKQCSKGVRSCR
jgi:hypothetical protein